MAKKNRRIAVVSGGTIPDQGLYGVFLSNSEKPVRVGELDEEMVFASRTGARKEVAVGGAVSVASEVVNVRSS